MKTTKIIFLITILVTSGILFNSCQEEDPFINTPPAIEDQEFSISENIPNDTKVDTVIATDGDKKQNLKYYIISGNFDDAFKIDSLTGILYVNNSEALNYELRSIFELAVMVKDDYKKSLSSSAKISILVNNEVEDKLIDNQEFQLNKNSTNGTSVGTIVIHKIYEDQNLEFSIESGNFEDAFQINSQTGVITVNNYLALIYENRSKFELTIKVKDVQNDIYSSSARVTIQLLNGLENIQISDQEFQMNRNITNGAIVGTVQIQKLYNTQNVEFSIESGNFENAFQVNSQTGVLSVSNNLAFIYENRSKYELTIKVKDSENELYSSSATITIILVDQLNIPTDGLIAYYPFNGNTLDISANQLNATGNASLTKDRFGNSNRAYHFNEVDQYIDLPNNTLLKPQFPFTISLWVYIEKYAASNQVITTDFKDDVYTGAWIVIGYTGKVILNYGNGNSPSVDSRRSKAGNTDLQLNRWYHITGEFISASQMEIYVNGINDGGVYTGYATSMIYSSNPGSIGRKDINSTVPPYYFAGSVDEVAIYNKALNQSEIFSLINFK